MLKLFYPLIAFAGLAGLAPAQFVRTDLSTAAKPTKPVAAAVAPHHATENVILIISDGLRWQEVFRGIDPTMATAQNKVEDPAALLAKYDAPTTEARRERLMPFLWNVAAKNGQLYGDHDAGSEVHVANNMWFSYPGYNEMTTGYPDDVNVHSNDKIPNPNTTVFEWLSHQPGLQGKVAVFGQWVRFNEIFNKAKSGLPVFAGHGEPGDAFIDYVKKNKPRVMFLGFGSTDHMAHAGKYKDYLDAAHRVDTAMAKVYNTLQSIPQYRDKTTYIFSADHGRGNSKRGPKAWNSHGRKMPGSNSIYLAIWGPDTPDTGVVKGGPVLKQAQIAATLATALGYDYDAAQPKAAPPIKQALSGHVSVAKAPKVQKAGAR